MTKERLKSPRARLFVALDLPDEMRAGIVAWQAEALGDAALRAVKPESLHITLAFLGYHPERDLEAVSAAALCWRGPAPWLELRPDPVKVPERGRPRAFALAARSDATLAVKVQAEIAGELERGGFYKPEKRPFWPHVTVARVRSERRGSRRPLPVTDPPRRLPEALIQPFSAVRVTLYRSYLRPQGAEYVPVAQLELPK